MKIETRAVHAGRRIDPATGAVSPPIYLTTTFERSPEGEYPLGFSYSREGNPNRQALVREFLDRVIKGLVLALAGLSAIALVAALND